MAMNELKTGEDKASLSTAFLNHMHNDHTSYTSALHKSNGCTVTCGVYKANLEQPISFGSTMVRMKHTVK